MLCGGLNTIRKGRQGKHLRIFCKDCDKKITINNKDQQAEKLLQDHLNRKSYRIIEAETGLTKETVCKKVNKQTTKLIHSNDLTAILKPQNYCGIILVDGKYLTVKGYKRGMVVMPFMDYLTHDIPVHIFGRSENSDDLYKGFMLLRKLNYPLKVVVCDESMAEIANVAKRVFPAVIVQNCLTHYAKNIEREFKVKQVQRQMKALQRKLDHLGGSLLINTHRYDQERGRQLSNALAELEFKYSELIAVQNIFQKLLWQTNSFTELDELETELNEVIARINMATYPYADRIKKRYTDYYAKRDQIIAHLNYPELDIPRTTNLIEGFNNTTLEIRLTTIRGFETAQTAENYINILILKRRFQRFTDCKGKFKKLNGSSPLQIANPINPLFNFSTGNWLSFCRNLKS